MQHSELLIWAYKGLRAEADILESELNDPAAPAGAIEVLAAVQRKLADLSVMEMIESDNSARFGCSAWTN